MSDVSINYRGSAIATMDASGTKTLKTEGKYCDDDIEVVYVKPGGALPSADDILGGSYPTGVITVTLNQVPWLFGASYNGGGNPNITQLVLTNAIEIPASGIRYMSGITKVIAQKVNKINGAGVSYNSSLTHIDILGGTGNSVIQSLCFAHDPALTTLIIRNTTGITPCTQTNAFTGSISVSKPVHVYVPQALKSTYEAATNWSTWVADGTIVFEKLEGSAYESTTWWE